MNGVCHAMCNRVLRVWCLHGAAAVLRPNVTAKVAILQSRQPTQVYCTPADSSPRVRVPVPVLERARVVPVHVCTRFHDHWTSTRVRVHTCTYTCTRPCTRVFEYSRVRTRVPQVPVPVLSTWSSRNQANQTVGRPQVPIIQSFPTHQNIYIYFF